LRLKLLNNIKEPVLILNKTFSKLQDYLGKNLIHVNIIKDNNKNYKKIQLKTYTLRKIKMIIKSK